MPENFKANFTQTLKTPSNKVTTYNGIFKFNKPSTIKWEYKKPLKKEICSNTKFISIINHNLEQVTFYNGTSSFFNLPKVLKNAKHHKNNIYTAKLGGVLYTLVVDKENKLSQILFKDKLDNIIHIKFKKMNYLKKENSKKEMECLFPKWYDIIKD